MTDAESKITTTEVGHLVGHSDMVTAIETGHPQKENEDTQVLITSSRDKTILIWKFNKDQEGNTSKFGEPVRCLTGHSHFISDLALTHDNNFLLSSSWDRELRLWDLRTCKTTLRFVEDGHTKEVLSCAISQDSRFILSCGADRSIKLWNIKGVCMHTVKDELHQDWVSKIRFIPTLSKGVSYFASVGWDGFLKVWANETFNMKDSFRAHDANINSVTVSPRGNFVVTAGKDMKVRIFEFGDMEKTYAELDVNGQVNALAFNPKCHWIAIGTEFGWYVWDFESKDTPIIASGEFKIEKPVEKEESKSKKAKKTKLPKYQQVTSIAWNTLGNRIFAGFNNGHIKVYDITEEVIS